VHIPDGYLDPLWCIATYIAAAAYGAVAVRKTGVAVGYGAAASVSALAALVFVAQMFNWPLPGGTSLHFLGSGLSGILLGPWLGFLAMASVVTLQALVFYDGGITTLGANILNMAVIGVAVSHYTYRILARLLGRETRAAVFAATWLGTVSASIAAAIELGLTPSFPYGVKITLPVMASWHALLGAIEAAITSIVVDRVRDLGIRLHWERGATPLSKKAREVKAP